MFLIQRTTDGGLMLNVTCMLIICPFLTIYFPEEKKEVISLLKALDRDITISDPRKGGVLLSCTSEPLKHLPRLQSTSPFSGITTFFSTLEVNT